MAKDHSAALKRLIIGLGCSAASGSTGAILPIVCYSTWKAFGGGGGGQDWSGLVAVVLATIGGIGGAISGLFTGAVWPRHNPLARALAGLGGILCIIGLYTALYSNEPSLCAWVAFPSAVTASLMSVGMWLVAGSRPTISN